MGRGLGFSQAEDDFIIANAENKTARELFELHDNIRSEMLWPERSTKSLARRVERLREDNQLGLRAEDARRKAYYNRSAIVRS